MSVSLSLKGVPPGKVDVFLAPDYIKVNFAPFLFEAFLAGEIVVGDDEDKESGRQLFDAGRIILQFKKTREGIWSDGPCKKKLRLFRNPNIMISKILTIQSFVLFSMAEKHGIREAGQSTSHHRSLVASKNTDRKQRERERVKATTCVHVQYVCTG